MKKAVFSKYTLHFKEDAGTSRGILKEKETYFIKIWEEENPDITGVGECPLFRNLSAEDLPEYEEKLNQVCQHINDIDNNELEKWSSIRLGIEMALKDLSNGGRQIYYPSAFTEGKESITINGLIWMGDKTTMLERIKNKLEAGFHCIKLKIGAIDFNRELELLQYIRDRFDKDMIELRVDANGAFTPQNAMNKLKALSRFDIHSIEQPIRQGQWQEMGELCAHTPIPIALDEELIGIYGKHKKTEMLETIKPQYIILKPALCGGFSGAEEWIRLAEERNIKWWVTSALESNVGLNALAQWCATLGNKMPQGLGTGLLYTNNTPSFLKQEGECLIFNH